MSSRAVHASSPSITCLSVCCEGIYFVLIYPPCFQPQPRAPRRYAQGSSVRCDSSDLGRVVAVARHICGKWRSTSGWLVQSKLTDVGSPHQPGLLPSTCILPSQAAKIRAKAEVARNTAVTHLREAQSDDRLPGRLGQGPDVEQKGLQQLSSEEVKNLARVFALPTWGPSALVARRLLKHAVYLRGDDAALHASKGTSTGVPSGDSLIRAASERGLRASEVGSKELSEGALHEPPFNLQCPPTHIICNIHPQHCELI